MENNDTTKDFATCVVIPAYNIAEYIARAIDSVLAQTRPPDQIIVVDDGSTDNTAEIIKSYGEKVTYIHQENAGLPAARNTGIKATDCQWVSFLDGDDEWLSDKLERQFQVLIENPSLVWVTGNYISCLCDEEKQAAFVKPQKAKEILGDKQYFEDFFDAFIHETIGNSNTMTIRRDVLLQTGLFRESMTCAEDIDMWFRVAVYHPQIGFVPEPVAVYHLARSGAISLTKKTQEKMTIICDLIERTIELSKQHDRFSEFKPCAQFYLRRLIRSWMFSHELAPDIRKTLARFDDVLPRYYKAFIRSLLLSPKTTSFCLHGISKLVRSLNLRRKVVRRPRELLQKDL